MAISGIIPRGTLTAPNLRMTTQTNGASSTNGSSNSSGSSNSDPLSQAAGGTLGKDQFVKLLITQMSNQDPLNPMDGKELATQLAQFSSVEQLIDINSKLDSLTKLVTSPKTPATNGSNA